jgi:hypothetical protein
VGTLGQQLQSQLRLRGARDLDASPLAARLQAARALGFQAVVVGSVDGADVIGLPAASSRRIFGVGVRGDTNGSSQNRASISPAISSPLGMTRRRSPWSATRRAISLPPPSRTQPLSAAS